MMDEQGMLYEYATVRVPFSATLDAALAPAASTQYGAAPYYFERPLRPHASVERQPTHTSPLETVIAERVAQGWEFLRVEDTVVTHDVDMRPYGCSTAIPTQAYYILAFRRVKRSYGVRW